METKYTISELEEKFNASDMENIYPPSEMETKYSPSEVDIKYNPIDFLNGPHTPQSLSDFSTASPDSLMSSRGTSPLSFVSTQLTDLGGDHTKIKQEPEKKPVKKRKSWGQQLPTPTTNLAPRKRAKTAEEKEQRRVERVLRNRAAAQKSREVKKQQLEKIEQERDVLKAQNEFLIATNKQLEQMKNQLLDHARRLEQENRRLRGDTSPESHSNGNSAMEVPGLDFSTTAAFLDPTDLISTCESTIQSDGSIFPSMTHQPAVLVCDLPCLQGILMPIFSLVLAIMMVMLTVLMEMIFLTFWTNLRTWTQVWQLLRNPLQCFLRIRFWKISLIAHETFQLHLLLYVMMSRVCSSVLAHLRIATDYSSPLTSFITITEKMYTKVVSEVFKRSFSYYWFNEKVAKRTWIIY